MFVTRDDKVRWTETVHDASERIVSACAMSDEGYVVVVDEDDPAKRRVHWTAHPAEGERVLARLRRETPGFLVARRDGAPMRLTLCGRTVRADHAWDVIEKAVEKHALSPWYSRDGDGMMYKAYDATASVRLSTVPLLLVHAMSTFNVDLEESLALRGLDGVPDAWVE